MKKVEKKIRKLSLERNTVRRLASRELEQVGGGLEPTTWSTRFTESCQGCLTANGCW